MMNEYLFVLIKKQIIIMIKSITNLIILQTNYNELCALTTSFNQDTESYKQKYLRLLQNYDYVPKNVLKNKKM